MKTLLKGSVQFSERLDNWSMETEVKWSRKRVITIVKSRKLDLKSDFQSCKLYQSSFLNLLLNSITYANSHGSSPRNSSLNFSGTKSDYSELLLESVETQSLMNSKNATLQLKGKTLIFKGSVKKKDQKSLSNIFKLIEVLMDEIDNLHTTLSHS